MPRPHTGPWPGEQDVSQEHFGASGQRAEKVPDLGCRVGVAALPGPLRVPSPCPSLVL